MLQARFISERAGVVDHLHLTRLRSSNHEWDWNIARGRQGPISSCLKKDFLRASNPSNGGKKPSIDLTPVHYHIFDRVYLVLSQESIQTESVRSKFAYFCVEGVLTYPRFLDDFGPMSLGTVFKFCKIMEKQLLENSGHAVALTSSTSKESVTNAVFLLGAYMILRHESELSDLLAAFSPLMHKIIPFRDISPGRSMFDLHLEDCWGGLLQARNLGWVHFGEGPGAFDLARYELLDDPLNADLHEIVPGKLVAMRGPVALPDRRRWADILLPDGHFSHRDFSPVHFAPILRGLGVRTVVRLNSPHYDAAEFESAGIALADLPFPDGTLPPPEVIAKFLAVVDAVPGAVAVHCRAGLGRTGTMIALYMIRNYGFTAPQAMGWLRLVRPGSVIGEQQTFLCEKEPLLRRPGAPLRMSDPSAVDMPTTPRTPTSPSSGKVRQLVAAAMDAVDARLRDYARRRGRTDAGDPGGPDRAAAGGRVGMRRARTAPAGFEERSES